MQVQIAIQNDKSKDEKLVGYLDVDFLQRINLDLKAAVTKLGYTLVYYSKSPELPIAKDSYVILCGICGYKRCPRAIDHRNACSNSNRPNQHLKYKPLRGRNEK